MDEFLDILLDSFLDTIKLLPFLLIVYFLIELLEYKNVFRFEKSKLLTGSASPAVGAGFGIIPQCGFSVISAELYAERKMSISALIAVFLATSDEAFPILISNYKSIPVLIALIITKFLIALIVGYLTFFIYEKLYLSKKKKNQASQNSSKESVNHAELSETDSAILSDEHDKKVHEHNHEHDEHEHNHEHTAHENHGHIHACCNHDIENQNHFNWKHPLIHSLKISLYIFVVNFLLTGIITLIGEETISNFLTTSSSFQPLFALIIGFIPNCASSVILTELYMQGMISFGSIVTGLCANAGIGVLVLFKENKSIKENFLIISILVISSLIFGYILHFLPLQFV